MIAHCAKGFGALLMGIVLYMGHSATAPEARAEPAPAPEAAVCTAESSPALDGNAAAWCGWVGSCYCCDDYCICP